MGADSDEGTRKAAVMKASASDFRDLVMLLCMGVITLTNAGLAVIGVNIASYYRSVAESQVAQRDTATRTAVATELIAMSQGSPVLELYEPIITKGHPTIVSVPQRFNESNEDHVSRYEAKILSAMTP